jgi:hypothetical protein
MIFQEMLKFQCSRVPKRSKMYSKALANFAVCQPKMKTYHTIAMIFFYLTPMFYAPINVMPDPREGGDTRGIDLISLLLGRGFDFI